MNFIKRNKKTFIAMGIFLIFVILLIPIKIMFFPSSDKPIYGKRLNGINDEKIKLADDKLSGLEAKIKDKNIAKLTARLSGKTIEVTITVTDDTDLKTAKSYGSKILAEFSDEQKSFYDFQIFIKKTNGSTQFPIIGYKHSSKTNITWTKDRAETNKAESKK